MEYLHKPVLLRECLDFLQAEKQNPLLIDATMGEGGHSKAFLEKNPALKIVGVDADCEIQKKAKIRLSEFEKQNRVKFVHAWNGDFFKDLSEKLAQQNFPKDFICQPDLILFDLGISIFHYEESMRGFSFKREETLDMRINEKSSLSAQKIVNFASEKELSKLFYFYGGEKFANRIAKKIVLERKNAEILDSKTLSDIILRAIPKNFAHSTIHAATRSFQALRIVVNDELSRLSDSLFYAFDCLEVGGKMAVISFHSLEDKIVKNFFRNLSKKCICPAEKPFCECGGEICAEILTKKPILPQKDEILENPASRSAKLRVVKKIKNAKKMRKVIFENPIRFEKIR